MDALEVTRRQEAELEEAELKMLRFSLRGEDGQDEEPAGWTSGDTIREARLRRFGHDQRRDRGHVGRRS